MRKIDDGRNTRVITIMANFVETGSTIHTSRLNTYTVFQKKTPTHIVGYKLRNSCLILIFFDIKIHDII